jgi:hypothetical protein
VPCRFMAFREIPVGKMRRSSRRARQLLEEVQNRPDRGGFLL